MKGFKLFLIIMLVLGLIFLIGIVLSLTHPTNDQNAQTPSWLTQLDARFFGPQPLKIADLTATPASCLQQKMFVVLPGEDCQFAVQQSTFTKRVATVQLVQGLKATVTIRQEQTIPVSEKLAGVGAVTRTNLTIFPGKAHGVLDIQCTKTDGSVCLLELK